MMYKYAFDFGPINNLIETHSQLISPDFSIIADEEDDRPPRYFFTSLHFNDLTEPLEIWRRGLFILNLYKGACILANGADFVDYFGGLTFSNLYDLTTQNSMRVSDIHKIIPSASFSENILNSAVPPGFIHYKAYPMCNRIFEARKNDSVRNLLLQIANGLNWINLYAILDSIWYYSRSARGKDYYNSVLQAAGFNQKEEKRFTGTANNFGLLGTLARHGDLGYPSPASTMTLTEAQHFIIQLTNTFLGTTYKC